MTPEREADIREILSGNANPAHVRVESAAHDLLAALDAERKAHERTRAMRDDATTRGYGDDAYIIGLEAALADVRQRCGGYPDSRVDGDGGIVAVVVRERDEAQGNNAACGLEVLAAERERDEAREEREYHRRAEHEAVVKRVAAQRERDEAQAALVALREAVTALVPPVVYVSEEGIAFYAVPSMGLDVALSAFPVTLAGQVRARVLREAIADVADTEFVPDLIDRLRSLADEAAKEGGR